MRMRWIRRKLPKVKKIDDGTKIGCPICDGTGCIKDRECGACQGSGKSTAPYDRKRNGTTIFLPAPTLDEVNKRNPSLEDVIIHDSYPTENGFTVLISWRNTSELRKREGQ